MGVAVHVAVGSSLGDREGHLATAVTGLQTVRGVTVQRASPIYETAPVGGVAERRFLNAVIELQAVDDLEPLGLLDELLAIEQIAQRTRNLRWEDRTLDLDWVLWEDRVLDHPRLQVPHPRLHERRFVLQPLADLVPDAPHPQQDRTVAALLAALDDDPDDVTPIADHRYPAIWPR